MSKYFIVKVDVGSKQKYIFSSNKLKEIIGASEIIRFVTEYLGREVLKATNKSTKDFDGTNDGNILFEAGGNAMYIFDKEKDAKNFNEIFSRFVMEHFDGLEILMVIKEFDIKEIKISETFDDIENLLTTKKGSRKNQFKRLGYGLTKICPNTRKPAGYIDGNKYISKESNDKLEFYKAVYEKKYIDYTLKIDSQCSKDIKIENKDYMDILRESKKIDSEILNKFEFTNELDVIAGEKNEGSYIGITCIDGNGMGKKIESFKESLESISEDYEYNKEYIKGFRKLTKEIKDKYNEAFAHTVEELISNYDNYYKDITFKNENKFIPLRPIILAGDDISFISNGKIAIEATRIFTEYINNETVEFGEKKFNLTTSAGVAIVKRNYPFSRGVKLANGLEKSSKNKLIKIKNSLEKIKLKEIDVEEYDASFIDWQVSRGDISSELFQIRDVKLTAKPYVILNENSKKITAAFNQLSNEEKLPQLNNIIEYNFDHFDKILKTIKKSNISSNLKSYFRIMNSSEIDAKLFSLKYRLEDNFKDEFSVDSLSKVIYDAIDIVNLYTYLKGEKADE